MRIFRSNTILNPYESSPALRYNLFFRKSRFKPDHAKKKIFTTIGARISRILSFKKATLK